MQCEMTVSADDQQLLQKLDQAAEEGELLGRNTEPYNRLVFIVLLFAAGLRVLVTHLERACCHPQLLARLARSTELCAHPEFCLFLSTELPVQSLRRGKRENRVKNKCPVRKLTSFFNTFQWFQLKKTSCVLVLVNCVFSLVKQEPLLVLGLFSPEIHPLILALVRVIDLSLSLDEIQGLMLTELLQSQCKPLLIQHLQFCSDKQVLADKVVSKEVTNLFVYCLDQILILVQYQS